MGSDASLPVEYETLRQIRTRGLTAPSVTSQLNAGQSRPRFRRRATEAESLRALKRRLSDVDRALLADAPPRPPPSRPH